MVISILLDTCAFWPSENKEKMAINKLFDIEEKINTDKIIEEFFDEMDIAQATDEEFGQMKTLPAKLQERYFRRCVDFDMFDPFQDGEIIRKIRNLLFPIKTQLNLSDERDCRILFIADKYRNTHLVTVNKKHFINNDMDIKIFNEYGIKVVTPSRCLQEVETHIHNMKILKERMKEIRGR